MTSRMSSVGRRFRRHARYNCGQASIMDKLDGFGGWPTRRRRWCARRGRYNNARRRRRRRRRGRKWRDRMSSLPRRSRANWNHYIRTVGNADVIDVDVLGSRRKTWDCQQQQQQSNTTRKTDRLNNFKITNSEPFTLASEGPAKSSSAIGHTVWVKKLYPLRFSEFFQKFLSKILLYVHLYAKIQNFIQLSLNLTKLCHIKRNHPFSPFTMHLAWIFTVWR